MVEINGSAQELMTFQSYKTTKLVQEEVAVISREVDTTAVEATTIVEVAMVEEAMVEIEEMVAVEEVVILGEIQEVIVTVDGVINLAIQGEITHHGQGDVVTADGATPEETFHQAVAVRLPVF